MRKREKKLAEEARPSIPASAMVMPASDDATERTRLKGADNPTAPVKQKKRR